MSEKPSQILCGSKSNFTFVVNEGGNLITLDVVQNQVVCVSPRIETKSLCLDRQNRLFTIGNSGEKVYQYSTDGRRVGKILDGIKDVKALCYDDFNDNLIVLMSNSTIAIYRITN